MSDYAKKVGLLPDAPGVYLLKDESERIIYVGKASSLRKRASYYLRKQAAENPRLERLISLVRDIDFIVTSNEVEALILEANLIKRYQPAYNVNFRDDKSYPYMVICTGDEFPRVMLVRGRRYKNAVYYGPFAHAGAVRETIDTLRKVFHFRACRGKDPGKQGGGPCLDFHIGMCSAPCAGAISPKEYGAMISSLREFMEGRHENILQALEARMRGEAARQEYELAARTRDRLASIKRLLEKQQAHSLKDGDQDVFAACQSGLDGCVTVFYVRGGKLLGKRDFFSVLPEAMNEKEILSTFLPQFYSGSTYIPKEILLSHTLAEQDEALLREWLYSKSGRKVRISTPVRGEKRELVNKTLENARHGLELHLTKQASDLDWISRALNGLRDCLGLERYPYRIECYDVSNLGGEDAVGSMAVYEGGIPLRRDFRRFFIKGVKGQNDVAMIGEVIDRRLAKLSEARALSPEASVQERESRDSFRVMPDLMVIDGGEAQLSAALEAQRRRECPHIQVIALAKRLEEIYLPGEKMPLHLPRDSEALHLLQRIRDEAHRYALDYHRTQRDKRARKSILDDIPGIGPKRKGSLLRHFGSIEKISAASLEDMKALAFLDDRTAENVFKAFHPAGCTKNSGGALGDG
jgi:excinuclease ABC subunit C